jgi:hypothetical protein
MKYCELLSITVNFMNFSEILGITLNYLNFLLYFLTESLIFQLDYLNFPTGLCFLIALHFYKLLNFYIFCWVINFLTRASWSLYWVLLKICFWQLNRSELLWIDGNYSELLWITENWWNFSELLWINLNYWNYSEYCINKQQLKEILSLGYFNTSRAMLSHVWI